ncbi:MAG: hypothetical protein HOO04_03265 [Phycisphaerae bacterium]|jgi:hypothetical protein|nr:hypothetical protein [Phycisphaerae bacterium]MBT5381849.1 hypothetical protein [Phycisphaerae bacterium]MBT5584516.1 hypothetical protein [Phycisphaerae bacterium]MBT5658319.1 hypothetical protein [Phycisphaerae bacterium]MBT7350907.1 hypothetical protein [Phycisphaerae bacterium]
MRSVSRAQLVLPILLIAGMVMHVSMPGLGCPVVASSDDVASCTQAVQPCKQTAEAAQCCRAMERAVEMTSCCMMKRRSCGGPAAPLPCEDEPTTPCDDCTMGSCPVTRWAVLLEESRLDDAVVFQMLRVDFDALLPIELVQRDMPTPDPQGSTARLSQQCVWLI